MTTIHEYRREVRDYLRSGYGVTDVEELHGGKHTKFRFDYRGRTIILPLNDRNGTGGSSAPDMKKQDIRRMLGPPPNDPDAAPARPRRTLDEMTAELPAASAPPQEATPPAAPTPDPRPDALPCRVALYPSNKTLTMFLPDAVVAEFFRGVGPRGVRVDFVAPDLWTVRHTQADRPTFREVSGCQKLQVGAAPTQERLGAFGATPAEVWLEGGCLRVCLAEAPRRYGAPARRVAPPPEPAPLAAVAEVLQEGREQRPAAEMPPTEDHLRALLEQIRAVEASGPYALLREDGAWVWRAVLTIK